MNLLLFTTFLIIHSLSPESIFNQGEKNIHGLYFDFDTHINNGLDWKLYGRYVTVRELVSATIYMGASIAVDHNAINKEKIDHLMHDMTTPLEHRILKKSIPLPTWYIFRHSDGRLTIHIRDSDHRTNALFELIIQALKGQRSDLHIDLDTPIPVINLMKASQHSKEVKEIFARTSPAMQSFIYQGFEHLDFPIQASNLDEGWRELSEKIKNLLARGRNKVYVLIWGYQGSGKTRLVRLIQRIGIAGLAPEEIDTYIEESTNELYRKEYRDNPTTRLIIAEGYQAPGWFMANVIYPTIFVRLDNLPSISHNDDRAREYLEMRHAPFDNQYSRYFFNNPKSGRSWDIIIDTRDMGSSLVVRTLETARWDAHYWDIQMNVAA